MNKKLLFTFIIIAIALSCKKEPVSSFDEQGKWLRKYSYDITIAGLIRNAENVNDPVTISFANGTYTKYQLGKVTETGPYQILKNYTVSYGQKGDAMQVNGKILGAFHLGRSSPDSIIIERVIDCFDCGGGEVFYRIK